MNNYPTVHLDLTDLDGNAFSLLGGFKKQALKDGRTQEQVTEVLNEAKSGDYEHLVGTLSLYCDCE